MKGEKKRGGGGGNKILCPNTILPDEVRTRCYDTHVTTRQGTAQRTNTRTEHPSLSIFHPSCLRACVSVYISYCTAYIITTLTTPRQIQNTSRSDGVEQTVRVYYIDQFNKNLSYTCLQGKPHHYKVFSLLNIKTSNIMLKKFVALVSI